MVYGVKETPDVALQDKPRSDVVVRYRADHLLHAAYTGMRSLSHAAGIRIKNKASVEQRIQHAMDGAVDDAVADRGFVDDTRLGVVDAEHLIWAMSVLAAPKVGLEREQLFLQMACEVLHVLALPLALPEFKPRSENIL